MSSSAPTSIAELDQTEWEKMISSQPWAPRDPYILARQQAARVFLHNFEAEVNVDVRMKMIPTFFDMDDGAICVVEPGFKCAYVREIFPAPCS